AGSAHRLRGVLVEDFSDRSAHPRRRVADHRADRTLEAVRGRGRRAADPRVRQRLLARSPAHLEAAKMRLLDARATEIERVVAVLDPPADRVPEDEMDRIHFFEAVGPAAVLAGEQAVPRAEDGRRGGHIAFVRGDHESEPRTDHALEEQLEEATRL